MAPSICKVFISYNRADRDWAEWIAGVIESAGYEPILQAWHFRPGENFVLRMQEAAAQTDFTIAVLSETYLKSEYTQPEWAAAFAQDPTGRKRKLIPVRVVDCSLTGMLVPIVRIDLIGLGESDAKRALLDGLKPSGRPAQPPPFPGQRVESGMSSPPFPPSLARLHGVPDLPPHYLPREGVLAGLKQKLLGGDASVAITGQGQAFGVQGMGGIGKTVLAAALAHDSEVRQAFPDGVYWLAIGQKPNLLELQNQLLRQLTGSKETLTTEWEAKDALREALEGRRVLVVLDDAWTIDDAAAFSMVAQPARLLITTRNNEVLVGLGAEEHRVDVLSRSDALKMLAKWVGEKSPDKLPLEATEVAKECGYLPLALAMIGAMIRLRPTGWKDALSRLQHADLEAIKRNFPGYPYPDLFRAIDVSIEGLESADRERYLDLAVFPEDQPIPEGALRVFWSLDEVDTRDCMTRLVARSLATWTTDESALILHDLQRDLIHKRRESDLAGLHLRLVEVWDALPRLDPYELRWIAYHLVLAGRKNDLRRLLLDFNYLQAKLDATDSNTLIADYGYLHHDAGLQLVKATLHLSTHVLVGDHSQLASQLIGRLLGVADPGIHALLKQVEEKAIPPWLRPLTASLTGPGSQLIRMFHAPKVDVTAIAITADRQRAIAAFKNGTLSVLDLEYGRTVHTLEGYTDRASSVAITPDGRQAVFESIDQTLYVWDLENGNTTRVLHLPTEVLTRILLTPDGRYAVLASEDGSFQVWDLESRQTMRALKGPSHWKGAVAITRDVCRGFSVSGLDLQIWDLERGLLLHTFNTSTPKGWAAIEAVALTPDGRCAVSASADDTFRVWDLERPQMVRMFKGRTNSMIHAVAITSDGRYVVSASKNDRMLEVWDLQSEQARGMRQGHIDRVTAIAVTLDGRRAVSGSHDGTLQVWDMQNGQVLCEFRDHTSSWIDAVAITPDGRRAVSTAYGDSLYLWDLENGQTIRTLEGHTDSVNAVAITPNGRRAISASNDQTLRLWNLGTGQTIRTLKGHTDWVNTVAITPDGRRAISAAEDQTLRLWDLGTGQTIRTLEGHTASIRAVTVTPDGRRAISASDDQTLRVWDLKSGRTLRTLEGYTEKFSNVAVTRDGYRAVSGSKDQTLRLWDLESGREVRTFTGHMDRVTAIALTNDGQRAVSAAEDRTLRVWDLESGKEISVFTGEGAMWCCAVAPDGKTIIAGDESGRVHLLRLVEADETKSPIGDIKVQLLHREPPKAEATNL